MLVVGGWYQMACMERSLNFHWLRRGGQDELAVGGRCRETEENLKGGIAQSSSWGREHTGTFQGQNLVHFWEWTTPPSAVILARKEGSISPRLPASSWVPVVLTYRLGRVPRLLFLGYRTNIQRDRFLNHGAGFKFGEGWEWCHKKHPLTIVFCWRIGDINERNVFWSPGKVHPIHLSTDFKSFFKICNLLEKCRRRCLKRDIPSYVTEKGNASFEACCNKFSTNSSKEKSISKLAFLRLFWFSHWEFWEFCSLECLQCGPILNFSQCAAPTKVLILDSNCYIFRKWS